MMTIGIKKAANTLALEAMSRHTQLYNFSCITDLVSSGIVFKYHLKEEECITNKASAYAKFLEPWEINLLTAMEVIDEMEGRISSYPVPSEEKGMFVFNSRSGKTKSSLGRIIRRIYMIDPSVVPDEKVGKFVSDINTLSWPEIDSVERVYGKDIIDAYRDYSGVSCMSDACSKYVKVYAENPDVVSLLTAKINGTDRPCAKALLWNTNEGNLLLDRVYHDSGRFSVGQEIIMYAKSIGAITCEKQYSPIETSDTVSLNIEKCDHMPYFDTFCYTKDQVGNIITLGHNHDINHLASTYGDGVFKCLCGQRVVFGIDNCPSCKSDTSNRGYVECVECSEDGQMRNYVYIDDLSGYVCRHCYEILYC
jgi:hypothetical protein